MIVESRCAICITRKLVCNAGANKRLTQAMQTELFSTFVQSGHWLWAEKIAKNIHYFIQDLVGFSLDWPSGKIIPWKILYLKYENIDN